MKQDHEAVWQNCLQIIKDNLPEESYNTWFRDITAVKLESDVLTIRVKSIYIYEFIEAHHLGILIKALRRTLGAKAKLEYAINDFTNYPASEEKQTANRQLKRMPPMKSNSPVNPYVSPGIRKIRINSNLKKELNFDNFIEGSCNQLARSAGKVIAANPGKTAFNPFFIFGESGMGKTHLAQAIGIEVKNIFQKEEEEKVVLYIPANQFEKQFTNATKNNNRNEFFYYYQNIDVLIIDDIQDFSGKVGTQNTFFHIFNHLHQSKKQLIITSDRPPSEINGLSKRLISRFKWGLLADLKQPDFETRMSILKHKAYLDGIQLPDKILNYIAQNVTGSIRELEGTLISLLAQSSLVKQEITFEFTKQLVDRYARKPKQPITIALIIRMVAEYFELKPEQLKSKSRKREIVQSRQIAMYFAKKYTKASLNSIGAEFGGKNHATVMYSENMVVNLCETDKNFKRYVDEIEAQIKGNI